MMPRSRKPLPPDKDEPRDLVDMFSDQQHAGVPSPEEFITPGGDDPAVSRPRSRTAEVRFTLFGLPHNPPRMEFKRSKGRSS